MAGWRTYPAYGVRIKSAFALPCEEEARPAPPDIEIFHGSSRVFERIRPDGATWFQYARQPDGAEYLRWSGLLECLVSADGRRIRCRDLNGSTSRVFETFLAGQVVSFALLKLGLEPLHATTVLVEGGAVAFLGDCGYGKSTLGAAFLQAGCRLLTDDVLVLREDSRGFCAAPGLPRIKLFPEIATTLLGERTHGTPMHHLTSKLVIPLDHHYASRVPAPLTAIYVLGPPEAGGRRPEIRLRPLAARAACVELLRGTFNLVSVEPERLRRQFDLATRLACKVPVKALAFPRTLDRLPAVRQAILSDLVA